MIKQHLHRNHIKQACGADTYTLGAAYAARGRVTSTYIQREGAGHLHFHAVTQGNAERPYKQDIRIFFLHDEIDIGGDCSCPVGYNCKHIAAACLTYLGSAQTSPLVDDWVKKLGTAASANEIYAPSGERDFLVYVLKTKAVAGVISTIAVDIIATRPRKNGIGLTKGKVVAPDNVDFEYNYRPWEVQAVDHEIVNFLKALRESRYYHLSIQLNNRTAALALQTMFETNRCYWQHTDNDCLSLSANKRPLNIEWLQSDYKDYLLNLSLSPDALILATEPPMYIDTNTYEMGMVDCNGISSAVLNTLANTPIIPEAQAESISLTLKQRFPELDLPTPMPVAIRENDSHLMHPWIILSRQEIDGQNIHYLSLLFDYDGDRIEPFPLRDVTVISVKGGMVRVQRNSQLELETLERIHAFGFDLLERSTREDSATTFCVFGQSISDSAAVWAQFIEQELDDLRQEGWHIEFDDSFKLKFIDADWEAQIDDQENDEENINDWFGLRFDLNVDGQKMPLAPLIAPILEQDPDSLPETLTLALDDHRYLRLPSERLRPFLNTLRELFNRVPPDADGNIRLSRFDATLIDDLDGQEKRIKGAKKLRELAAKLRDFSGIQKVKKPKGLKATLRDYQKDGLNWLQFLREYHFNGILADDMGLGKTVQTLAHLLVEKQSGRMEHPTLVIAPTSLMGNWRREAQQFTPALRVIVLHGNNRHALFDSMSQSDLILTTYPLLARDTDLLLNQQYHYVVLDEAQAIKNPRTKMAKTVRDFKTNHRLCLTGTPLENHLGELWSLYDFLMPGFLGSNTEFTHYYRTPIEKHGNDERRRSLARRVQPFLLRRDKSEVASELPPKTEIIHNIELGRDQAQLYEGIRVSMDKRVREAIKNQGLARSHITILDALLKLRQVCCDPRLAKLKLDQGSRHSAKLEWLMEMLPEQLEEGRRVLLFSQFTSMLSLIEEELLQRNIKYTKLTGQTRKRDDAIQRFREGEVNLFLISLKAGGTGLNLTEADTVIIYDPWWNPAVESQAIDRAHRIGQDKPVFIYKLVTANSVEEKMLAMQARKRDLAKGVYQKKKGGETTLIDAESLKDLFAPLN